MRHTRLLSVLATILVLPCAITFGACADSVEDDPDVEETSDALDTGDGEGDTTTSDAEDTAEPDTTDVFEPEVDPTDTLTDVDVDEEVAEDVTNDTENDTENDTGNDIGPDVERDTEADTGETTEGPITRYFVDDDAPDGGDGLTWATAFNTLGEGLTAANASDEALVEVWVAAGTYHPGDEVNDEEDDLATFGFGAGVAVFGGFVGDEDPNAFDLRDRDTAAHESILSGDNRDNDFGAFTREQQATCFEFGRPLVTPCGEWDSNGDGFYDFADYAVDTRYSDNSAHVVTITSGDDNTRLDGFTVVGGVAVDTRILDEFGSGAGVFVDGGRAELAQLRVFGNVSTIQGAGVYVRGTTTTRSFVSLRDSELHFNHSDTSGGGLSVVRGRIRVFDSSIVGNTTGESTGGGAGALLSSGGNMEAFGVQFVGNTSHAAVGNGGGAIRANENMLLESCTFVGNQAPSTLGNGGHAGAILIRGGRVTINNSTFFKNYATSTGALEVDNATAVVTLSNSILWGSSQNSEFDPFKEVALRSGTLNVVRSLIEGSELDGALIDDPQFIDPLGADGLPGTLDDNLRLFPTSPGIDAGDTTALPDDVADWDDDGLEDEAERSPFDIDGNPRVADVPSAIDSGTPLEAGGAVVDLGAYERIGD